VLLGALLLVVVAVLWIVVGTFISSGPPPVRPAEGAAAAVDTSGPRPIEGSTIRATATSVQKPDDGVTYGAVNTLDDRPTTAWNSRGKGVGTRLTYTFAGPVELASISVLNGYHKIGTSGRDLWALNERIRQLRVVTENDTFVWELPDTKERQTLTRDFGRTRTVRLQILSTYAGEKYQDVGLSEIGFTATG
jgi:hypothetical protein